MNHPTVVLAGATGDLGGRIAGELTKRGARVRALVRKELTGAKAERLESLGVELKRVDFGSVVELGKASEGADVVVSALAGLRPVIVEMQTRVLDGALRARVPRFIPSDFAIDFTRIPEGWNRNLNLRNEFRKHLENSPIKATSILNGAFTDMLTGMAPFILFRWDRILCWGDPDQKMDWTTIADTAAFTAQAAIDDNTPRYLRIAGDQMSANDMARMMTEITGRRHKVFRPGGPGMLRAMIGLTRALTPTSDEIYPAWQGMQYMHNMYAGIAKFASVDNDRYPMRWTSARQVLTQFLEQSNTSGGTLEAPRATEIGG